MPQHRTEPQGFDAADPDSTRLTREAVIAIHRAHIAGVGWDTIASQHSTTRKNVQRTIQGRRHRHLHPNVNPSLYADTSPIDPPADPVIAIVNDALREARDRILRELRETR